MQAGKLDQRITIQSATYEKSASGEDVPTWATFAEVSAAIEFPTGKGREKYAADRDNAELLPRVRIHRMPGIRANMRILWTSYTLGDVVMDIRAVEPPVDRSHFMFLQCRILS